MEGGIWDSYLMLSISKVPLPPNPGWISHNCTTTSSLGFHIHGCAIVILIKDKIFRKYYLWKYLYLWHGYELAIAICHLSKFGAGFPDFLQFPAPRIYSPAQSAQIRPTHRRRTLPLLFWYITIIPFLCFFITLTDFSFVNMNLDIYATIYQGQAYISIFARAYIKGKQSGELEGASRPFKRSSHASEVSWTPILLHLHHPHCSALYIEGVFYWYPLKSMEKHVRWIYDVDSTLALSAPLCNAHCTLPRPI